MDIDPRVLPDSSNEEQEQEPVKTPEAEVVPAESTEDQLDIEDLKRKAEVSSQNFERAKKAELEVKELRNQLASKSSEQLDEDLLSDEGKLLKSEISVLRETISKFEKEKEEQAIYSEYPELKDKKDEFTEFSNDPDNAGIKKEKLAKLFLLEKGLLDSKPQRKGLEKPTGGSKASHKSGISQDEIKRLRENQPRRYQQMIQNGKINPDDIV